MAKLRYLVVSLVVAAAALVAAPTVSAAELLTNGGFETGTLSPWSCSLGSAVSSPVHSGTHALQGAASTSDDAQCTQTVSVLPNTAYTLSGWVEGSYVYLGVVGGASTWTPGATSYTQLTVPFTTGASQTSVQVFLHGWYGTGTYFADDVSLSGAAGGPTVPAVPGTPTAGSVTNSSVALSWAASSGSPTGYRVYEGSTVVASTTGTSATISGLAACSTHTYSVTAYNSAGESAKSGPVTVTTAGCSTAPPTPGGLHATTTTNTSAALVWTASAGATGYRLYEGSTQVYQGSATSATISGLAGCSTHSYTVTAYNAVGESAKSAPVAATTSGCTTTGLPKHDLIGYFHASFANGSGYTHLADVPAAWDIIDLAFGEPTSPTSGVIQFNRCSVSECANVESDADFKSAIQAKQAAGKKVLLSIGGANGQVSLTTTAARDAFVSSVEGIINQWGLNGLDVDFENQSLSLNQGDSNPANPTTPPIVNLISALQTLKAHYGASFVLTMAPETFFVQLGYQFYGGSCAGCDPRSGAFLPVIYAMRNDLTVLTVQDYNSGPITGLDNQYHTMGGADFDIAMTDMLAAGFPVANTGFTFPALRADQIGFGTPSESSAGNGFVDPSVVQQAVNCLTKGVTCGGYTLRGGLEPNFRGVMTWSINWDRYFGWTFMNSMGPYLHSLP